MRVTMLWLAACRPDDPQGTPPTESDSISLPDTGIPPTADCALPVGPVGCDAGPEARELLCQSDFDALASLPLDASIPGARSVKTVLDQLDGSALHFQNSVRYPIHWEFAYNNLSVANGLPPVPDLGTFNASEYYSPDRRFILGAVVRYDEADTWAYEIAPYDTASADMVADAFYAIRDAAWFGPELKFHPASALHENDVVPLLPADIPIIATDELFAGVEFQPYNLGEATGLLTFRTAEEVDGVITPYRELVVLDAIPNDISVTAGIITAEFQTPLAHINVLSINRGTPNMALRDAWAHPDLAPLEGKWVKLIVTAFDWSIEEITAEEAETWWQENKPDPLAVPVMDLSVSELRSVEDIVTDGADLATEITEGLAVFGSKGTNYAALVDIGEDVVPIQDGFVIPFHWYRAHMDAHGLQDQLAAMILTPEWLDSTYRAEQLELFKADIVAAPLDPVLLAEVEAKADLLWPDSDTRFRSSTNAEDLGNFTGAGLYNSQTGERGIPNPDEESVEWAIKTAWSNLWNPRAYEERDYYSIDQLAVGMALLTTSNFPDEEANGVCVTNNIYDTSGLEPGFIVNVQIQDYEVVQPPPGVLSDSYIHYFYTPGEPIVYLQHSTLVEAGETVLTTQQSHDLGVALDAIHQWFYPVYGVDALWYGMDIEFKFDDKNTPGTPQLFIKQARPFPWTPGGSTLSVCTDTDTP